MFRNAKYIYIFIVSCGMAWGVLGRIKRVSGGKRLNIWKPQYQVIRYHGATDRPVLRVSSFCDGRERGKSVHGGEKLDNNHSQQFFFFKRLNILNTAKYLKTYQGWTSIRICKYTSKKFRPKIIRKIVQHKSPQYLPEMSGQIMKQHHTESYSLVLLCACGSFD